MDTPGDAVKDTIKKLVEAYGPSGNEDRVRDLIRDEIHGAVDEIRVDPLGNLIAMRRGSGGSGGAKLLVAAHMDEIGVIVTYIEDSGFLRFSNVGGVSPFTLIGQRVMFANGTVGTFGREKLDDLKDLKLDKMFIDIGAKDKAEAESRVKVGDVACFYREMTDIGGKLIAKSMDDRAGCAVVVETIKRTKGLETPNEVYFVFTVQEEVGLRGAKTAAYGVNPDIGIAVDLTLTGDTPEAPRMAVKLGAGPAIKVKDMSVVAHPKVKNLMVETASAAGIPYQLEILDFGGTDAGSIHTTREGIPSGVLSIPARYVHTPSEMVDIGDVEGAIKLLAAIVKRPLAGAV
ncbi:MAG: M42 family metallopeptidase [Firmicutes bacterium]|nr:M42 family metallopeptidase [Bacillota bacterium]